MNIQRILQMREGGAVKRCHTMPHHGEYNVAHHTFNMLLLLDELWPNASMRVVKYILRHDLFERWTGDMPTMAKVFMPALKDELKNGEAKLAEVTGIILPELDPYTQRFVKALDWIEFLMWCDEQIGLGYTALNAKRHTVMEGIAEMNMPPPCQEFVEQYSWRRTNDVPS